MKKRIGSTFYIRSHSSSFWCKPPGTVFFHDDSNSLMLVHSKTQWALFKTGVGQ